MNHTSANFLELIERNSHPLPKELQTYWKGEMSSRPRSQFPYPKRLILEVANTCNLDCPMCRVGQYGVNPDRFMSRELFDDIAESLFPSLHEVRLNGLGEGTLLPWFDDCVQQVKESKIQGELITNLTCDQATIETLLEAGFVNLVSWDATDSKLFELLRKPARFNEQVTKLKYLGSRAKELGESSNQHLIFTLQKANINELSGMIELANKCSIPSLIVNVIKLDNEAWIANHIDQLKASIKAAEKRARELDVNLFLPDHLANEPIESEYAKPCSDSGCRRPWEEVVIRWNGDITVCNMFNPFIYGNWSSHGFDRSWNGSLAETFRKMINTDSRHPYCDGCYYITDVYERGREV